jgi:hypothetical protein
MTFYKLYLLMVAIKTVTCSCNPDSRRGFENIKGETDIWKIGEMPAEVDENSGLAKAKEDGYYWTHNDSGGKPELYKINSKGKLDSVLVIEGAKNVDWEDLAEDDKGNLYIGDFGNNGQNRRDLTIYKRTPAGKLDKIRFNYADQEDFPSSKPEFDCEAFFWYDHNLYLFTKSWAKKKQSTRMYKVSDEPGVYELSPLETFKLDTKVTAADISPDKTKFALLTYGKLYLFSIEKGVISFDKPLACLKTGRKQTEGMIFDDNQTIIFTNEQGKIYSFRF